jgi:hypothetical protein
MLRGLLQTGVRLIGTNPDCANSVAGRLMPVTSLENGPHVHILKEEKYGMY